MHIKMVPTTCRRTEVRGQYERGGTHASQMHIKMVQSFKRLRNDKKAEGFGDNKEVKSGIS